MHFNRLGRTGLFVSELCLGTMTFGAKGMFAAIGGTEQEEAEAILKAAIDGGVNFIDTADIYSEGVSEQMLGRALKSLGIARQEVVIATKAFGPMGEGVNDRGASRFHLLHAIDESLKRLQLDHVDLYQIHGWDAATPIEETLRALDDIVRSGRARYVGVSNWTAWQIAKSLGLSERLNLERFASVQAYYSLAGRELERDILPMAVSEGLGVMLWSPLAGGFLSGKYGRDGEGEGRRAQFDFPPVPERGHDIVDALREIAERREASVPQVALAWLLHQQGVSSVIVGAKRLDQLTDNLGAVEVALEREDLDRLDQVSRPPREYPGWMLERQGQYRREALTAQRQR